MLIYCCANGGLGLCVLVSICTITSIDVIVCVCIGVCWYVLVCIVVDRCVLMLIGGYVCMYVPLLCQKTNKMFPAIKR